MLSGIIMSAVFPPMSRFFISSKDSLKLAMEKSSKYLFIIALPIAVGTFLLADSIIVTIYDANYEPATIVLKILILYVPLRFISTSVGWTLSSINKEHLRTLSAGIAIVINIILNLILIPRYGITGAAVSTAISQLLIFLLYQYFITKKFKRLPLSKIVIKPTIASTAMGILVYLIRDESLLLIIPVAAILYFILLFTLKTFDAKDMKMFKDVIRGITKFMPFKMPKI
jgi:O-antigen/teichoic acid export membrane protein